MIKQINLAVTPGAASNSDKVLEITAKLLEVSEKEMVEAIAFAHEAIKDQITAQLALAAQIEKATVKREYNHENNDADLAAEILKATYNDVYEVAKLGLPKHERSAKFKTFSIYYGLALLLILSRIPWSNWF